MFHSFLLNYQRVSIYFQFVHLWACHDKTSSMQKSPVSPPRPKPTPRPLEWNPKKHRQEKARYFCFLIWLVVDLLKNMSSSVGMMKFPTEWNTKKVPNHQPVMFLISVVWWYPQKTSNNFCKILWLSCASFCLTYWFIRGLQTCWNIATP